MIHFQQNRNEIHEENKPNDNTVIPLRRFASAKAWVTENNWKADRRTVGVLGFSMHVIRSYNRDGTIAVKLKLNEV